MTDVYAREYIPKLGQAYVNVSDGTFYAGCGCEGHIDIEHTVIIEKHCWVHKNIDHIDLEYELEDYICLYKPKVGEK